MHPEPRPAERLAIAAFVVLTLAGPSAVGAWGAVAGSSRAEAEAPGLVAAAVAVAAVAWVVLAWRWNAGSPRRSAVLAAAIPALPLGLAFGEDGPSAAALAATLAGVGALSAGAAGWIARRLPTDLDHLAGRRPAFSALVAVLCAGVWARTAVLSVFMADPGYPGLSMVPDVPFAVEHSCLSAYVEGDRLAAEGVDDLYAPRHWPDLVDPTRAGPPPAAYAPFKLDAFAYPPAFLVGPRLLLAPLDDFRSQRAVWFGIQAWCVAAGLWIVASWLGGAAGLRALLFVPLLWLSQLMTLQVGNAHPLVIVAAMLAFVAFDARRPALGGALLAFAVVAKLSPAVLLVVLAGQARLREVAWTVGMAVAWVAVGVAAYGAAPLVEFVTYELPRLSSGEALVFLSGPETVVINLSPFGMPFKLEALGVDLADPWATARSVGRAFTALLVVLTALGAVGRSGPRARLEGWAALLALAPLQSPLAPPYTLFPALWLLSIGASDVRGAPRVALLTAVWLGLSTVPGGGAPGWVAWSMGQSALAVVVASAALVRGRVRPPSWSG